MVRPYRWMLLALLGASLFLSRTSQACPSCPLSQTVRQEVFADDFGNNLLIALAPFLVVGLVARRAERIGRAER